MESSDGQHATLNNIGTESSDLPKRLQNEMICHINLGFNISMEIGKYGDD